MGLGETAASVGRVPHVVAGHGALLGVGGALGDLLPDPLGLVGLAAHQQRLAQDHGAVHVVGVGQVVLHEQLGRTLPVRLLCRLEAILQSARAGLGRRQQRGRQQQRGAATGPPRQAQHQPQCHHHEASAQGPLEVLVGHLLAMHPEQITLSVAVDLVHQRLHVILRGHGAHIGTPSGGGDAAQRALVELGHHHVTGLGLLEAATSQRDGRALGGAHSHDVHGHLLLACDLGGGQSPLDIRDLTVGDEDDGLVAGLFGLEQEERLADGRWQGAALGLQGGGVDLAQDGEQRIVVEGQGHPRIGPSGEDHQADAIPRGLLAQVDDLTPGALHAARADVLGVHAAGDIHHQRDVDAPPLHVTPLEADLRLRQGHREHGDASQQQRGLPGAPFTEICRRQLTQQRRCGDALEVATTPTLCPDQHESQQRQRPQQVEPLGGSPGDSCAARHQGILRNSVASASKESTSNPRPHSSQGW